MMNVEQLNKHSYALWFLGRLFDKQAQPIHLTEVTDRSIKLEMRINLQKIQMERLIIKPINEKMVGYNAKADYDKMTMEVTLDANQAKQRKPSGNSGKVAA